MGKSDEERSAADEIHRSVATNILDFGWHAMGVLASDDAPPFVYTIGLATDSSRHEFVIVGLSPEIAHGVLVSLVGHIETNGEPRIGEKVSGVVESFDVVFCEVADSTVQERFGVAFSHVDSPRFLQVVWPDARGRFPDSTDMDLAARQAQILDTPTKH